MLREPQAIPQVADVHDYELAVLGTAVARRN
jgi:hypothetical protein